jgi:Na+-driven multidrug efflux pump
LKDEASGSVLRMTAPLVVSFWMRAAVTFVDTVYASFLGDSAIAAIGLTIPMEFLMIAAWVGLSTGLTSCLARAMGSRAHVQVDQYLRISRRLVATVSPLFTVVGAAVWVIAPHLGLDPATARSFQIYGTVLIGGSAFTMFWSIIPDSLIKSHQDTRSTMWAGILTNIINVSLNTLFLFGFHWGIFGIALSTVLGRIGGLAYARVRARHHESIRRAGITDQGGAPDPAPLRAVLRLAVPSSVTFALMATESALINGLLASLRHATEAIAAYSIYYRVVLFALQPVIAASVAMLPFAARRHGAGDGEGIRRGLRQAALATALYSLVIVGPVMLALAPRLARLLSESDLTMRYATFALQTVPLACFLGAPFLLCRPVFEAMQRGRPGLTMALIRYVVLTGPLAWLGMVAAQRLEQPPLFGLIVGTLAAGAVSSAGFYLWLRSALRSIASISASAASQSSSALPPRNPRRRARR